jgi:Fur family peroxide stress response transcriptional regulator
MAVSRAEVVRRMKRFMDTCRENGMKVTHQRTEVFRELARTEEHPNAETIYQQVKRRVRAISRDTVYRALADLETLGLAGKAGAPFRQGRYDANTDPHHHFICTECGLIRDFYSKALDELPLPKGVKSLGRIQSSHVQLLGICAACAGQKARR